jgi:hypothetical protein
MDLHLTAADRFALEAAAAAERRAAVAAFYLFLAASFVVARLLIERARPLYRWPPRPTARRLR